MCKNSSTGVMAFYQLFCSLDLCGVRLYWSICKGLYLRFLLHRRDTRAVVTWRILVMNNILFSRKYLCPFVFTGFYNEQRRQLPKEEQDRMLF